MLGLLTSLFSFAPQKVWLNGENWSVGKILFQGADKTRCFAKKINMSKRKRSVLYVDDDPFFLKMVSRFLRARNYLCNTADSVAMAIEMLDHFKPDIIISDYEMPEISGSMFRRCLLCRGDLKNIPFIFYTSCDISMCESELVQLDVHVISKSSPLSDLNLVSEVLNSSFVSSTRSGLFCPA